MVSLLVAKLVTLSGCFMTTLASSENVTFEMGCSTDDNQFIPNTRAHKTNTIFDWPQGKIPYIFDGRVTFNDKQLIRSAMRQIECESCIRYIEVHQPLSTSHYLRILVKGTSCSNGFSGRVSTKSQVVILTSFHQLADEPHCKARSEGGIVHELMHVLGIQHTQKRSDSKYYIRVNRQNILKKKWRQYLPPCYACKNHGVPYDCSSIMHYGTLTSSIDNRPTMTAIVAGCSIAEHSRIVATKNDWDMLRAVAKNQCSGGGYTDISISCSRGKALGYCTNGYTARWMAKNCAKTCKCCKYTDKDSHCPGWKPLCTTGDWMAWMARNCAKTCKC